MVQYAIDYDEDATTTEITTQVYGMVTSNTSESINLDGFVEGTL